MGFLNGIRSILSGGKLHVPSRFALLRTGIAGTMSKFYMARDLRTQQIVGLKILDREKTLAFEARFKGLSKPSEGEIAMQLAHPRIVKTFEYGRTTDDEPYLVMEYIDGPNLNTVLVSQDPLLEGRRVRFIRQAAEALAAVHQAGFIHRDVCPRNFLVCANQNDLKLIDFGLTVPAMRPFLLPGNRTGTPNYMAPELVRRQPTDQRVDIFALGVAAFELLTGELPWARGTTGMAAMTHDQPPADIRKYCPNIHPKLAKAIAACLLPDPAKRCPSVARFISAISSVEQEEV